MSAGRRLPAIRIPQRELQPVPVRLENNEPVTESTVINLEGRRVTVRAVDLLFVEELGKGNYGKVDRVKHDATGCQFALKRVRRMDNSEQEEQLREVNLQQRITGCKHVVFFYGAMLHDGDLMLLMELMDIALDRLYKTGESLDKRLPADTIRHIAHCVTQALQHMYTLRIIHRDVKPSNVLCNLAGCVKVCDFGISGPLVNSIAHSKIGCNRYMAPERIDTNRNAELGYTSASDVWSLGISLVEICNGRYPYSEAKSIFDLIGFITNEAKVPKLDDDPERFSAELRDFVSKCLLHNPVSRWRFARLLEHPYLAECQNEETNSRLTEVTAAYVKEILPHSRRLASNNPSESNRRAGRDA